MSSFACLKPGANTSNKELSLVERVFGDKFPEVVVSQNTDAPDKTTNTRPATQTSSSVTVSSQLRPLPL